MLSLGKELLNRFNPTLGKTRQGIHCAVTEMAVHKE
jgi:hypothetical protein